LSQRLVIDACFGAGPPKHRQRTKPFRNRSIRKYASIPWFEKANRFHCALGRKRRHLPCKSTDCHAMERLRYEPFGEPLAPEREAGPRSRASRYLLWAGTALFWSLVGAIVSARAVFFEPGVFDDFSRVAALVKAAIF
jgi:hypothetical protein